MSDTRPSKSLLSRAAGVALSATVFALAMAFSFNQINQFLDAWRGPVTLDGPDGVLCIHYRGAMACVQTFKGPQV